MIAKDAFLTDVYTLSKLSSSLAFPISSVKAAEKDLTSYGLSFKDKHMLRRKNLSPKNSVTNKCLHDTNPTRSDSLLF